MDLDLEISGEKNYFAKPHYHSINGGMNTMKEASSDGLYSRIKREGHTKYSKPQVDRAVAAGLKYGIFELKNNRCKIRDNVLDDEDTIYWRPKEKRERTPYRLENNDESILNPEKGKRTFRKLSVSDGVCPRKKARIKMNECKRKRERTVCRHNSNHGNSHFEKCVENRHNQRVRKQLNIHRYNAKETRYSSPKVHNHLICHKTLESCSNKDEDGMKKRKLAEERRTREKCSCCYNKISVNRESNGGYNVDYVKNHDHKKHHTDDNNTLTEVDYKCGKKRKHSDENVPVQRKYFKSCCEKHQRHRCRSTRGKSSFHVNDKKNCHHPRDDYPQMAKNNGAESWSKSIRTQQAPSEYDFYDRSLDNDLINEWCNKSMWNENDSLHRHDGAIKQFDNSLKIEPIDSLSLKNLQETSYIS